MSVAAITRLKVSTSVGAVLAGFLLLCQCAAAAELAPLPEDLLPSLDGVPQRVPWYERLSYAAPAADESPAVMLRSKGGHVRQAAYQDAMPMPMQPPPPIQPPPVQPPPPYFRGVNVAFTMPAEAAPKIQHRTI